MSLNNQQDEIRLEDILKILWRWRLFIVIIVMMTVIISVYIFFVRPEKPLYGISGIIRRTVWDQTYSREAEIESIIKSYKIFNTLLENKKYLNLFKEASGKDKNEDMYQWFISNTVIDIKAIANLSMMIEVRVESYHPKYLKEILDFYINAVYNYEKGIFEENMKNASQLKSVSSVGIPPAIIKNSEGNTVVIEKSNSSQRIKITTLILMASLITSMGLSLVLDYLRKIDWK